MKDASEYLAHVKALVIAAPYIVHWKVVREEAQGDIGLFRYQLTLADGGMLEMFERFQIENENLIVTKYSFHWQDANGSLRKRWDNARHHPEIVTQPHHVHEGRENNVAPHNPVSAEEILEIIRQSAFSENLPE
ncbi:MAG: DUF6516 family protein [Chloroflexota bacterium]